MADRLSPALMAAFSGRKMRAKAVREAYIDNDSISPTDITARVKEWGDLTTAIYNVHPFDRGSLRFPVMQLTVDNSDGYFDRGGVIFPNGNDDFESTVVHVSVLIKGVSFLSFDGRILQPEFPNGGILEIIAEHPLSSMTFRKWSKADRIGGDTGVDWFFA